MNSGGDYGESRQPECKKLRVTVCAYLWKLGRESPNTSQDEMHETREGRPCVLHKQVISRALERLVGYARPGKEKRIVAIFDEKCVETAKKSG